MMHFSTINFTVGCMYALRSFSSEFRNGWRNERETNNENIPKLALNKCIFLATSQCVTAHICLIIKSTQLQFAALISVLSHRNYIHQRLVIIAAFVCMLNIE